MKCDFCGQHMWLGGAMYERLRRMHFRCMPRTSREIAERAVQAAKRSGHWEDAR